MRPVPPDPDLLETCEPYQVLCRTQLHAPEAAVVRQ